MMYLGWWDDNPKKASSVKITEAIDAYMDRFRTRPNVVLVNEADSNAGEFSGVNIRVESYIRKNNFWVGFEEPNTLR